MHALLVTLGLMSFYGKACQEPVDMLFEWQYGGKQPGASVAVIKDGNILFERSYGMANVETGEKATVNTNYRLASMTKQFTAMSILLLEEQGKLSLDDKVVKYIPELKTLAPKITLKNLLTHTSGLPEYEMWIAKDRPDPAVDKDVLALLAKQEKLDLKTYGRFRYGNTGYVLLALIVERVAKQSFAEFLKRNIFTPLGMGNSLAYDAKATIKNRAFGYTTNDEKAWRTDQDRATAVLGDGGIYSSITDLAHWIGALDKSTLLKKRLADATSIQVKTNDPTIGYGFGWRISEEQGEKVVWHTGTTSGFKNALMWVPSRKLGVIVLTNRKNSDSLRLAWRVLEHYWDR